MKKFKKKKNAIDQPKIKPFFETNSHFRFLFEIRLTSTLIWKNENISNPYLKQGSFLAVIWKNEDTLGPYLEFSQHIILHNIDHP